MAIVQISKIQVRSGNIADLPQLAVGEFGWAIDEQRLFIGNDPNTIGALPDNTEIITGASAARAAGNTGQIQFNTDGDFDASANLTWDNATAVFTVNGTSYFEGNVVINGNVDLNGNIIYIDIERLAVQDPIIEVGNGPNNTPLTANNGFDRGLLLHNYTTQPVDAFMGWDTANGQFEFASNVSIFEDVVTVNDYGNVKVDTLLGNVDGVNANLSGNVQGHSVISTSGFFLGPTTISEDYTIPAGFNAFTPGPVTVPSGVVVTVPPGSNWTVP
jgi:hypothetical protein